MKRIAPLVLAAAMAVFAAPVVAHGIDETIKGEVIDMKCHKGKGHEACATTCVRGGEAAAIKVGDVVYMIVGDYTANKNEKLVQFVAKDVEATGEIGEKDGHKTIDVKTIKVVGS
jgi:hypothetical protein